MTSWTWGDDDEVELGLLLDLADLAVDQPLAVEALLAFRRDLIDTAWRLLL